MTDIAVVSPIEIYLDARFAQRETPEYYDKCRFDIRNLDCPDGYQMYISLVSFVCPHSFPVINRFNNRLLVTSADDSQEIIVTPGHYSVYQLMSLLDSSLPFATLSFDKITYKITLKSSVECTVSGSIVEILGFNSGQSGTEFTGERIVNLTGDNSIFVLTDLLSSSQNIDSKRSSIANVFACIPVNTAFGSIIHHQEQNSRVGLLLDDTSLQTITVSLEGEDRDPLLCQLPWIMCLQVRFLPSSRRRMTVFRPSGLAAV